MSSLMAAIRAAVYPTSQSGTGDSSTVPSMEFHQMSQNNDPSGNGDQRTRIKAILTSPEAVGRANLAEYLAYETDMEPASALAILSKAEKAQAEPSASSYEQRRLAASAGAVRISGALAMPSVDAGPGAPGGGLVANMKRRHGITE